MDPITYKPTSKEKEITLEDKDFMFHNILTEILFELKRSNMKNG